MHPKRLEYPNAKRPRAPRKEYDRLVREAWRADWWCERKSNGYIHCYPPDDSGVVIVRSTPSKQGTFSRTRDQFRKRGLDV